MIGVVIVTHGRLAVEFRSALEHVVGPQQQIEAVTIGPDDDIEQRRKDIIEARGVGIRRLAYEAVAVLGFVVDLAAPAAQRLPTAREPEPVIENIALPRLAVAAGEDPLPMVLTWLGTDAAAA